MFLTKRKLVHTALAAAVALTLGKVTRIITSGEADIPGSSFKITGTKEDPGALIRVYQRDGDGYKPTDTIVGHKVKTLTKIDPL